MIRSRQADRFFQTRWSSGASSNSKKPISDLLDAGQWAGRRCFIIGGGPSLKDFDFSLLENELTIGINRAYEKFSPVSPTILYSMDTRFYRWCCGGDYGEEAKRKFVDFSGIRLWCDLGNFPFENLYYIRSRGRYGTPVSLGGIFHGNNSGYGAIQVALALGAAPIYLLGFDLKHEADGRSHWHSGHPEKQTPQMIQCFHEGFKQLSFGFSDRIVNLNYDSAVKVFPFGDLPTDLPGPPAPVFVSYFTKNSGYEKIVVSLRHSLWRHSLKSYLRGIPDRGGWIKNCAYKPTFLLEMLDKFPTRPVIWIDADAIVLQPPDSLLGPVDFDVSLRFFNNSRSQTETISSFVYFANNDRVRALLRAWERLGVERPGATDQETLAEALKLVPGLKVSALPPIYNKIFDERGWPRSDEPFVVQNQASRNFRK